MNRKVRNGGLIELSKVIFSIQNDLYNWGTRDRFLLIFDCSCQKENGKKIVAMLKSSVCSKFMDGISGIKNSVTSGLLKLIQ